MWRRTLSSVVLGLGLILCLTLLAKTESFTPSPHIYKLNVSGCRYAPFERTLTGFRIKEQIGIVTALHGVAGCQKINAQPAPSGPGPFNQLSIGKVDIDRDMALLWSTELAAQQPDGLEVVTHTEANDYLDVEVIGYPYDLIRQKPTIEVKIVETTTLGYLIPPNLITVLSERDSPAIDIQVFSIQAHFVPGHSGAPLLNHTGRVIGVANGGLDFGRVEMSWAIPWYTIKWKTVTPQVDQDVSWTDVRRLFALATSDPNLFAFTTSDETRVLSSTLTVTSIPTLTVAPSKTKLSIKVTGAGSVRSIDLLPFAPTSQP